MNTLEIVNSIVVSVGIPSLFIAVLFTGKKLQKIDDLDRRIESIEYKTESHLNLIDAKISNLGERVSALEGKVDLLFKLKTV